MPALDLIDETFVVAEPAAVAAALRAPALWAELFPDLALHVFEDRGDQGLRFTVTGALVGTSEWWVEPWGDGAIVHYYLRADLTRRGSSTEVREVSWRQAVRARDAHARRVKAGTLALKRRLEAGRPPGVPRLGTSGLGSSGLGSSGLDASGLAS